MNAPGADPAAAALCDALRAWCEALEALRLTLTEDRPAPGDSALADGLADAADEVIGWLQEAAAQRASVDGACESARLVARAMRTQGDKLFGRAHQLQLDQIARTRGRSWRAWVTAVHRAAEPLWARTEQVVKLLGGGASPAALTASSHTTYAANHSPKSETFNRPPEEIP